MPRKWGPCAEPRCPVLCDTTYCETHAPKPYAKSTRRLRLPPGWAALRRRILRRDNYECQCFDPTHDWHVGLCGALADQVDHIIPGDNHDPANLAAICRPCHMSKSGHEGGTTQGRYRP
jgi:5-methylcytosine-specific restriction enzyme A